MGKWRRRFLCAWWLLSKWPTALVCVSLVRNYARARRTLFLPHTFFAAHFHQMPRLRVRPKLRSHAPAAHFFCRTPFLPHTITKCLDLIDLNSTNPSLCEPPDSLKILYLG